MPIMIMHGTQDPVVPFPLGQHAFNLLKEKRYQIDFRSYPMQHQLCSKEIEDIKEFLM